jgi:DNA-binding CsgD family transcriptional regulator
MERWDTWPFSGRASELGAIEERLVAGGAGLLVVGDAGVGKTRLIREALARWSAAGHRSEWLVATRGLRSIPFGTVSHLLPAGVTLDASPLSLIGEVAASLTSQAGRGPTVVAIDDAHLLDDASASLLHQLTERRVVVPVGSTRTATPLSAAVAGLWKDADRLPISPLPAPAVDQLLAHALPGQVDPISHQRLHRLVAGNPLLLRELLADARENAGLVQRDGVWRWRGPLSGTARLGELVRLRLESLDPEVLAVLEVIGCGEPLALAMLRRVADPAVIEQAERSGLAVTARAGNRLSVRLVHPLYGEALRANLPGTRKHAIWRQLAEVLTAGPMRRRDDVLVAAVWELRSGHVRRPQLLLDAARQAVARFDLDLAERLARAARGNGNDWETDRLLAQILHHQARHAEAIEALPQAPPTSGPQHSMWAVTRASILYWGLNQVAEAERTLLAAAQREPGQCEAIATHSWILLFDGRCQAALDGAERVLGRPDAGDNAVIWAAFGGTIAAGWLGQLDRALAIAARGRAVADGRVDPPVWFRAQVGYGVCQALRAVGELDRARDVADQGYQAAVSHDAPAMAGLWAGLRGVVAKAQGRLADARVALLDAVTLLDDSDEYQCVRPCLAELAGTAALSGDVGAAREWLARAEERKSAANRVYEAWVELNRAWAEAASGAVSVAIRVARGAATLARETEQLAFEAIALYDVARLGGAPRVVDSLDELAQQLRYGVVEAFAQAARALATGNAERLERAGATLAAHGHPLHAAELFASAAGAHRRDGHPLRMAAARERAAALGQTCQGARTPLLRLDGLGTTLSRREREVATMAITLPSRAIADKLGLSVHTVNNTLARAFAKLGVSSRGELERAL